METFENKPRLENLYQQLIEMVNGNYNQNIGRTDSKDHLEAITALINMITEQTKASIISLANTRPFYSYAVVTQLLFILDESYQIEEMGSETKKLLQYEENDTLGLDFKRLLYADSRKFWARTIKKIVDGSEREKTVKLNFMTKKGLLFPTHCKVMYFPDGQCLKGKTMVTSINISIQKKALDESLHRKVYGHLQKKSLGPDKIKKKNRILLSDLESIRSARDYISNHLDGPLSLKDIARSIGTNELKLKMGFREICDMTVFQFIKEERLRKAHALVLYTNKNIGFIAGLVGFKQGNHLSREFKKKYGHSPTELRMSAARSKSKNFNSSI